jgi:hypothetical protein
LAVFVRFWLTSTPALPDTALGAAQTKGRERYEGFIEAPVEGWRAAANSRMKSSAMSQRAGPRAMKTSTSNQLTSAAVMNNCC